jgi:hypothetical protein
MTKRRLLGYDSRACASAYVGREWSAQRRSEHLLKPDVEWPLSVDTMVWPSLFHFTSRLDNYRPVSVIDVEPTDDRHLILRLWGDVSAMESMLRARTNNDICFVRVAIELWHDIDRISETRWQIVAESLDESETSPMEWLALGYDIADGDFVSGLTNCGYNEKERTELSRWATELNEFGLFVDFNAADDFRRATDRRVPEHAPFFVYRLLADLKREKVETQVR